MTEKESLWYLIKGLLAKKYDINTFCSEFTRIYNLELDYDDLSVIEDKEFKELCEMAARFSDDDEELMIPQMYVSELEIKKKAKQVAEIENSREEI